MTYFPHTGDIVSVRNAATGEIWEGFVTRAAQNGCAPLYGVQRTDCSDGGVVHTVHLSNISKLEA